LTNSKTSRKRTVNGEPLRTFASGRDEWEEKKENGKKEGGKEELGNPQTSRQDSRDKTAIGGLLGKR